MRGKGREGLYQGKLEEKRNKMEEISQKVTARLLKGEGMGTEDKT